MRGFLYIAISIVMLSSCRKDIDVKLPEYKQKLVVEGSIETGLSFLFDTFFWGF
jgi:hypothetical protein